MTGHDIFGADTLEARGRWHRLAVALRLFVLSFCIAGFGSQAFGHEIRPTISTITFEVGGRFVLDLSVNLEALVAAIGPEHRDSSTSANAGEYRRLRGLGPAEMTRVFDAFEPTLRGGIVLEDASGRRLDLEPVSAKIGDVGDTGMQRTSIVVYSGRVPAEASTLRWRFAAAFGPSVIRARQAGGDVTFSDYLMDGAQSREIPVVSAAEPARTVVFFDYLKIGFEHIVPNGIDHTLFVVGLFLLSARFATLLTQATLFTLAHSATLLLGALGVLRIAPSIVEPLIALSIVYVAVENIFTDRLSRWRPAVIFAFGLLHGLGFAGILTDIGMSDVDFWTGLIAFNLGVELGQVAVIVACFLTIGLWFGQKVWYRRRITLPLSGIIAAIASAWFVQRVLY